MTQVAAMTKTAIDDNNEALVTVASTAESKQCMICFDTQAQVQGGFVQADDNETCNHWTCRPCLRTYLLYGENDRKVDPICPDPNCQIAISTELATNILGRDYMPKVWLKDKKNGEHEAEGEQAFSKWLAENGEVVQQCKHCNVWIYREDGCEAMQCLCGYRFCWECKMATSECECGWCLSHFYDNIRRAEGLGLEEELATEEDLIDFAKYYERKEGTH